MEFDDTLLRSAASGLRRLDTFSARLRDEEEHGPPAFEVDDVRQAVLGVLAPARDTAEEDAWVTAELQRRDRLRSERRFAEADEIRKRLREVGNLVEDARA